MMLLRRHHRCRWAWRCGTNGFRSRMARCPAAARRASAKCSRLTKSFSPTAFTASALPTITCSKSPMVTSIKVTPSFQSTKTGSTFELLAKDQSGNDISASVTWIFYLTQTTTQETGFTLGIPDQGGQPFTVGTLTPAVTTFPVTLDAVATLTTTSGTVTSIRVQVQITS